MKYKIKEQKAEKEERYVELWLDRDSPDSPIELRARHSTWPKNMGWNHILKIYADGHIESSSAINEELGFRLDIGGRIMIEREE